MAFASVKVRDVDKADFDRLLHETALKTGRNITQHELFHLIVREALAHKTNIIRRVGGRRRRDWSTFQFDLPEPSNAAEDLDGTVYGL